jgi:ABC-type multidrug transport system ATPase subunit
LQEHFGLLLLLIDFIGTMSATPQQYESIERTVESNEEEKFHLSWEQLTVRIRKKYSQHADNNIESISGWLMNHRVIKEEKSAPKCLLNNLSGEIVGPGLVAVMGRSGSGKTTFLSSLAMRLDLHRMSLKGSIKMNGRLYSKRELKRMSGCYAQATVL